MQLAVATVALLASGAAAFAPSLPAAAAAARGAALARATPLRAEAEEEEAGFDLDLNEMFDLFDAADKEEDFEEAVAGVKDPTVASRPVARTKGLPPPPQKERHPVWKFRACNAK